VIRADHSFFEHAEKVFDIVCREAILVHVFAASMQDCFVSTE
jgi:hypothetical protein